jgi:hypothetical protein
VRTTLDLDPDILQAAKELAQVHGVSTGRVLSDLVRKALEPRDAPAVRNGVPLLPRRPAGSSILTIKLVNELRDGA